MTQRNTNVSIVRPHRYFSIAVFMLSASLIPFPVIAETVTVPIKLDYPVLRQLMLNQLFSTPDSRKEILRDPAGCSRIFLFDPRLREHEQNLEITARVQARLATAALGSCMPLFDWDGDARILTEPVILRDARAVGLNVLRIELHNPQGQPMTGPVSELAGGPLQSLLSRYEIDLSPTIAQLNALLPDLLRGRSIEQIDQTTASLRLASIVVTPDGIDAAVSFRIDKVPVTPVPAETLSAEEMEQLEANWRRMDAMVTFAVKRYAAETHQQPLREALAEILLDARYRLRDALMTPVTQGDDPVRHWFVDSWQRLGPVLLEISLEGPAEESMLLISLLTATDLLHTLDRLGPTIGLDISADGLRRLGRMLSDRPGTNPLFYDDAVDPELRELLDLSPVPAANRPSTFRFDLWPIRPALAESAVDRLELWVPSKSELPEYLPMIRDLLHDTAIGTARTSKLKTPVQELFGRLVLTTAWQESCWRQYEIKSRKVVTLRSSSGDSGLMQINERVWRGLYDIQKLRWDIAYNVRAGAEVLHMYLVKYALKRDEHLKPGGVDNLARSAYSAYNGGPSRASRYRDPDAPTAFKKIDAAFWKKYQAVKQGGELQVAECLGGDVSAVVHATTGKGAAARARNQTGKHATAGASDGNDHDWILAQNENHYTLQLAAFGSYEAARRFTDENGLKGKVAIASLTESDASRYVVLNGSFENKTEADAHKRRYPQLKPWVRQFQKIHASLKRSGIRSNNPPASPSR